ncbi:MAG: cytochrome c [Hyphomicrobiaceae bacterium]|nr:cytochrome c [Hyphomicrobiaceae bacterium]
MTNTAAAALVVLVLGGWAMSGAAAAQSPEARGRVIAEKHCARCHAIGREGASPEPLAVPFRELPKRYPVEQLAEALAEGIVTGHPAMPEFTFEPPQIEALLAYLASLDGRARR